jgi:photosystem II stability/assembly factor-like uncharacterized protein
MKKIYISICLTLISAFAFSQWTSLTSGTTSNLYSVYFTDANNGYAVGASGTIVKTTNGGLNWTEQASPTSKNLYSLRFTDANTGYAVGQNATIIKTTNAGVDWSLQTTGGYTMYDFFSVNFPTSNKGFICGYGWLYSEWWCVIYKTLNGGANWTEIFSTHGGYDLFNSVYFVDSNNGYISYSSNVRKTTNGGANWTDLSIVISGKYIGDIRFLDVNNGYIVGYKQEGSNYNSLIVKTTDGGSNWSEYTINNDKFLSSVAMPDANTAYSVGELGLIVKTTDAGANWFEQTSNTAVNLAEVHFVNTNLGFAVGDNGTILKTVNGGGSINEFQMSELAYTLFPNPSKNKITINNNGDLQKETIVNIFDIHGMLILSNSFKYQNSMDFDVSSLAPGVYMVKIQTEQGFAVKRLVVQ